LPPKPGQIRFYADESFLGTGKALTIARDDVVHVGHPLVLPQLPMGVLDPDWMPEVAKRGWIVLARDRRIRTKPAELAAFKAHGLRVFWIAGKKDLTNWGNLVRMVRRWDEMESIIASRGAGPWFMAINEGNITEIGLK
jgi:hypothetical protein